MRVSDQALANANNALAEQLEQRGLMIATAESCTGGWVAKILTDRAGSSAYVQGGLVTYSDESKRRLLCVKQTTLAEEGAVSELVVREMVAGALAAMNADVALAISGVAGPGGGTEEKPVGTVWFAWGGSVSNTHAVSRVFEGDRDAVRKQATLFALEGVCAFLEES
ncbi:MAG: nicotinamide-nucleotide amidohydrolase family protein [Oleiphilaceae bacterium]|nr:nicotinamide-nucleotide amidohydrolase family protein [Oleiphilaceae bacterium]